MSNLPYVIGFDKVGMSDVGRVGGKNASLGEMIVQLAQAGVRVPGGFATTADAYRDFLAHQGLDRRIEEVLAKLDTGNIEALTDAGTRIRAWIRDTPLPVRLEQEITAAYNGIASEAGTDDFPVAVRSSATAEDLSDASFAGQQETFLNIRGLDNLLDAARNVFASLYNDRAISYRVHKGFAHS